MLANVATKNILDRDPNILEYNRPGRTAVHPHLILFLIHRDSIQISLNYEGGEIDIINLGVCKEKVGKAGV